MNISIIGTGNMGSAVATGLIEAGQSEFMLACAPGHAEAWRPIFADLGKVYEAVNPGVETTRHG